ncbi:hypothetical protein GQ43DRAFT_483475 [Delitschia confertaspora ATCC 74209]|uniref:Zn(2)-C6 fungal-type domain-containing protein n=1 Tax=Delitschia confertaspora ATCC 74209 TaxID=1513339 RepID=A0A9P4MPS4_9PLEO|nr:hypothetical protein GQ43DRAFT_483475 [Delitschia confertaspora ATCC 74209]
MDEQKLRVIERQHKLRVKTGCETCRKRRVKCDEARPECLRCSKSGRKCEGYKHVSPSRDLSPTAAASFRNPSFLVVPQNASPISVPRSPSRSVSPVAAENRSFCYFRTQTLPKWTEFFDSDLWSRKILQLSHSEPAIKHGVLALSSMHERFETFMPAFTAKSSDFAFMQYMRAVKHSNKLLTAYQEGKAELEKILIACIIFTCYENLTGNSAAANMHLSNGIRILNQHKGHLPQLVRSTTSEESIANVLFRFDLQAMTFSEPTRPYDFSLDNPPDCPDIPDKYTKNGVARNDLVGLLRCMMWISGVASINEWATEDPTWLQVYNQLMSSFEKWQVTFEKYQSTVPLDKLYDPKVYAGNTLLKIYAILARTTVASGANLSTEMAWDSLMGSFQEIVDLAETIPTLPQSAKPHPSAFDSPSPPRFIRKHRPIAPNPASSTPPPSRDKPSLLLLSEPPPPITRVNTPYEYTTAPGAKRRPASFSPSFELSPIVPLFFTACRCRDPVIRRRAISLLLGWRRREGAWDSFGAGMVALQCVKIEEGLDEVFDLGPDNWLPLSAVRSAGEIGEMKRVQDVWVSVTGMPDRNVCMKYLMSNGEVVEMNVEP